MNEVKLQSVRQPSPHKSLHFSLLVKYFKPSLCFTWWMGQAKTMSSIIYILSRDNILGHETQLHGSCSYPPSAVLLCRAPKCSPQDAWYFLPRMRLQNLAKFSSQTLWESSEGMQQQLGKVWKMGPLQKGYENWFTVEGGELKNINRRGCFKHSESAGKKEETHRKCKSNVGWIFTVLVVA